MLRRSKIWTIVFIIIIGYVVFGLYSWIVQKQGFNYPHGSFLFFPGGRYTDFFTVNQMVSELRPYVDYYSTYPPLVLAIAFVFSLMADYRTYSPYDIIHMPEGKISFVLFVGVFTILILGFLYYVFAEEKDLFKHKILIIPVILCITFSAPYIWMLDRGNYLIVAIVFYLAFAYFYGKNDTIAAIFLGLTAAIKIYPLLIFFIFAMDKKWKELRVAVITVFVSSLLPFLFFRGGLLQNTKEIVYALFSFGGGYPHEVPNVYFCVGLTSLLRLPFVLWNNLVVPETVHVMLIYLILGSVLALWTLWNIRNEQ